MADKWPLANGNWSNAANWNGGTKPVAGDDVYADGKTVTIDENVNIGSGTLRTSQRSGGTIGGGFSANSTVSIVANIVAGSTACVTYSSASNVSITGNVQAGTSTNAFGLSVTSGTITVNGNVTGGSGASTSIGITCDSPTLNVFGNVSAGSNSYSYGIRCTGAGIINVTGQLNGGSGLEANAIDNQGSGTVNIIGNVTAGTGSGATGIWNRANGVINITGNVSGNSGGSGIWNRSGGSGSVNVTGDVLGSSGGYGVRNSNLGNVTITGNVTGGSGFSGALNENAATMIITGNCTGGSGSGAHGAINATTGTLRVYGTAIGNDYGLGYVSNNGTAGVSGFGINTGTNQAITTVRGIRYGAKGQSPTAGLVQLDISNLATSSARFRTEPNSFTEYTFGPPENIGGQPAASNVRLGTVYNFGNTTGTCAVPPAASVAYGVPVDNTTGTAVLTEAGLSALLQAALQPNAPMIVERSTNDNKAITFSWPVSGATITGQKSIDNGAYSAVAGAITFLRTESNRHYYALAYNAADRASVESSIRYMMTDGTYTKYFNLKINPPGITQPEIRTAVGLASANLDTQLTGISTKTNQLTFTNANQVDARTVSFNANVITSSALASSAVDEIVDAVYDEPMSGHTVNGTYGSHLVRSANQNQNTVQITGSQHIAASIHESEPNSIHETAFDSSSLTARILASDAVSEIQSGLASQSSVDTLASYVDTEVAAIKTKTDLLPSDPASMTSIVAAFTEIKGVNWSSSTDTLKKIAEHANDPLDEEDIATLVFQALVGSAVARSALPTSATPLETLKYIDYDLDITASTAASSKLVVSIGCENHSNPNIEIDNETGLLRLNAKTDFQAAWATLTRVSPTLVRVHINAIAMKELVVGEYLLELREITVDDKVILRREYQFFVRSGAGRIID